MLDSAGYSLLKKHPVNQSFAMNIASTQSGLRAQILHPLSLAAKKCSTENAAASRMKYPLVSKKVIHRRAQMLRLLRGEILHPLMWRRVQMTTRGCKALHPTHHNHHKKTSSSMIKRARTAESYPQTEPFPIPRWTGCQAVIFRGGWLALFHGTY